MKAGDFLKKLTAKPKLTLLFSISGGIPSCWSFH